jgi:hypothetical protein
MSIFVLPILKPVSSVTTTVTQSTTVTTTTISQATYVTPLFGPPPTRILGYFTGCPSPLIPFLRVPIPIITRIVERCNIRPPWIRVIPRWSVLPARYVLFRPRAFGQ